MKVLITGGCGFIGSNLVRALASEGIHRIRIVDDLSTGSRDALAAGCEFAETFAAGAMAEGPGVELIIGDVCDEDLAIRAAEGADAIVHLAANAGVALSVQDPRRDCRVNVIGTLNYLEAARKGRVKRLVFASSSAPVGECDPPIHERVAARPVSPYGASKLAGEGYCSAYFRTFGVETVALRFGNVYGPGSAHKSSVVAKFIATALAGETLEVYGDGGQTRDFLYIDDLVRAVLLAARSPGIGGEIFQIATGRETTVSEILQDVVAELRRAGIHDIEVAHREPRLGDVRRNFSDTSKAEKMLGWRAEVSRGEGIAKTVSWFLEKQAAASGSPIRPARVATRTHGVGLDSSRRAAARPEKIRE